MNLNESNYHSDESARRYLSASSIKRAKKCEYGFLNPQKRDIKTAFIAGHLFKMLVTNDKTELNELYANNPQMISSQGKTKGQLKTEFRDAVICAERVREQKFISELIDKSDKQMILTGTILGEPVRMMCDLIYGDWIVDLKTAKDFKRVWCEEKQTDFGGDKYPELVCGDWECNKDGVKIFVDKQGFQIACYHPIMPIKRLKNIETKNEKIVLAFNRDGYWQEVILDSKISSSSNKVASALSEKGANITTETAKPLVRYFAEIMNYNKDIPVQLSTSKMGWINGFKGFMPFTEEDIIFDSCSSFKSVYEAISEHGDEEKYMELVSEIRASDRNEPKIIMAVSLASVLVKPCGVLSFIFHLFGEAGKGKTVATMLSASIWGNPAENGYMSDPKSTATAFEAYLDFLNNMPFICDDLSKIKRVMNSQKQGDFSDFIYFLCSEQGKKRSNVNLGVDKITSWKNCSITNAEKPITSEISNVGELLRVIELETHGVIFNDGSQGKKTADTLRENYGFLGKKFIQIISELGFDKVREIHEDFVRKIRDKDIENEKVGKQVQPMALILTADKILADYIFKDNIYLDFDFCFNLIRDNKSMSDNERAYEFICNEVQQYSKRFATGTDFEPEQRWGYIYKGFYLINPNVFSGMAERGNFNKKMFVRWAVVRGKL